MVHIKRNADLTDLTDRDGFLKKGTYKAAVRHEWNGLTRIYFALIKYTVDLYLKFNLNPNEKFIRLNQLNLLDPCSFLPTHRITTSLTTFSFNSSLIR